ncbi:MAG: SDR family oxidoreductase [Betaproteobacteria bacterium]|nr:SDR family oxidoreductase [Betaproteobacteria bacterium]
MKHFAGRVAVITGAGSGFGREFALHGASLGMRLVLADIQQGPLDETIALVKAQGAEVVGMTCDVSQGPAVEALAKLTLDHFGGVNLLFNNAGVGSGGFIWENTVKDWEWILGVNVWGVIHGVRVFTPLMLEQAKKEADFEGYIVNTSSMAGLLSPPMMGAYNVSKHAVVALSETLYHDLQVLHSTIGCSVLCPAFVPTGISTSHRARPSNLQNDSAPTESMKMAQKMTHKAVSSGRLSARDVALMTFEAIREGRFYILTHPKIMATVKLRLEDIEKLQNPRDPFALKEENRPSLDKMV